VTSVVTADHGESLGEHEATTHGLFLYHSSLRVPWIMAGPGVDPGIRVDEPVSLVQVLPTILELLDVPFSQDIDGTAFPLGTRKAREAAVVHAECLFPRIHYDWAGLRSVRRGQWKLIDAPRAELYDLASDPDETRNLFAENPELVAELRAEIERHASRGGELGDVNVESDEETRQRLEALGYVGGSVPSGRIESDLWNPSGRDPKDMVGFFNQLQDVPTLMMSGRNDEASALLTELHRTDPNNRNVLEKLALLRRLEENWGEARRFCEEILRIDPGNHRTRKNLASALLRLDDREGAIRAYQEVVARDPSDAEAWGLLGSLRSEDANHREAIVALTRAVELDPRAVDFKVGLARAWEDSGEVAAALREYDRALEEAPGFSAAVNGKALLLSHNGKPREAVQVLRAGLPGLSEDVETLNNLAWILTNESIDPNEAYKHARRAAELAPDDPAILDTLGWAAIRSGRASEAIAPLTRAWSETGDAEVRAHLGIALAESGRAREGVEHLRAAAAERSSLTRLPEVARWLR
jgi:tetratricopeptide (TPR) repeat protein